MRMRSRCYRTISVNLLLRREGSAYKNHGHGQLGFAGQGKRKRRLRHQGMQCAAIGQWNYMNDKTRFFPHQMVKQDESENLQVQ